MDVLSSLLHCIFLLKLARADVEVDFSWESQSDAYCADDVVLTNEILQLTCRFTLDAGESIDTLQIFESITDGGSGTLIYNAVGTDPAGVNVESSYTGITRSYSFDAATNVGTLTLLIDPYDSSLGPHYNCYAESDESPDDNDNMFINPAPACAQPSSSDVTCAVTGCESGSITVEPNTDLTVVGTVYSGCGSLSIYPTILTNYGNHTACTQSNAVDIPDGLGEYQVDIDPVIFTTQGSRISCTVTVAEALTTEATPEATTPEDAATTQEASSIDETTVVSTTAQTEDSEEDDNNNDTLYFLFIPFGLIVISLIAAAVFIGVRYSGAKSRSRARKPRGTSGTNFRFRNSREFSEYPQTNVAPASAMAGSYFIVDPSVAYVQSSDGRVYQTENLGNENYGYSVMQSNDYDYVYNALRPPGGTVLNAPRYSDPRDLRDPRDPRVIRNQSDPRRNGRLPPAHRAPAYAGHYPPRRSYYG